jgi:hypothetical protein
MSNQNITLTAIVSGNSYSLDLELPGELDSITRGLIDRGFQKILTDAHSTATRGTGDEKRKADDDERAEDVNKRLAKLVDGSYVFGGGGGKSTTPEQKALKHTLQKFGVKFAKGETVLDGLESLAMATAEKAGKDYAPEMAETIRAQLEASEIYTTKLAAEQASVAKPETGGLTL